ncbi:MAG: hypothetical protein ACO1RX_06805 [Candidatus Sericytochromatia bacterium]
MTAPGVLESLLERQARLLLAGCPASGKTWLAQTTAREWAARRNYGQDFVDLAPPLQDGLQHASLGLVRTVWLHPGLNYAQFVEGVRPEIVQGQATQVLRDGVFKRLCREATLRPDQHWVMVLEDVHRCDASALFGEALGLLGQRSGRLQLALSGDTLVLPTNLRLVATVQLNALPQLDPVWLRHFSWWECPVRPDLLKPLRTSQGIFDAGAWLMALNAHLRAQLGPQARGEEIGHGYFFEEGHALEQPETWGEALLTRVWPRLQQLAQQQGLLPEDLIGDLASVLAHAQAATVVEQLAQGLGRV